MLFCDFCGGLPAVYTYPCTDFVLELVEQAQPIGSIGGLAACEACAALIEAGARREPATRVGRRIDFLNLSETEAVARVRRVHDRFFAHRCGPRRPLIPN